MSDEFDLGMASLLEDGLVKRTAGGDFTLTEAGRREAGEIVERLNAEASQVRAVREAMISTLILSGKDLTDEDVDNLAIAAIEGMGRHAVACDAPSLGSNPTQAHKEAR